MKRLNRIYHIFIAVLMLFTISSFTIVAAENEHGTLIANHLKIPIYRTYRMYVKTYNKATQAYIAKGERIVLRYTSANEAVIEAKGNAFKSVGNGKTEVTLRISGAYPGTLDAFDPNNVLDEMKFTVEVNVQGCGYCYVSLSYLADDPNPTAIKNTLLEQPKISWNFANGVLNIQAEQYVGELLSIYSISGKCLQKTTIQPGNNIISSLTHQPFFIRVGNNAAIKVLP